MEGRNVEISATQSLTQLIYTGVTLNFHTWSLKMRQKFKGSVFLIYINGMFTNTHFLFLFNILLVHSMKALRPWPVGHLEFTLICINLHEELKVSFATGY